MRRLPMRSGAEFESGLCERLRLWIRPTICMSLLRKNGYLLKISAGVGDAGDQSAGGGVRDEWRWPRNAYVVGQRLVCR